MAGMAYFTFEDSDDLDAFCLTGLPLGGRLVYVDPPSTCGQEMSDDLDMVTL